MQLQKLHFFSVANACSKPTDSPARQGRGKRLSTRIVEARNSKTEDESEIWSNQQQHGIEAVQEKPCSWLLSNHQGFAIETLPLAAPKKVRVDWHIRAYFYPGKISISPHRLCYRL